MAQEQRPSSIKLNNFNYGGIADSDYVGGKNSVSEMVGMDIHSEPGVLKVNQQLKKDSGTTVDEFVKHVVESTDGNLYFFSSESGKVWKKSSGSYSLVDTTATTDGEAKCLGAMEFDGYIYWATENFLHRINVNKTGSWSSNVEENWKRINTYNGFITNAPVVLSLNGVDEYAYTAATTMSLSNANIFTFTCWFRLDGDGANGTYGLFGSNSSSAFSVEVGNTNASNVRYAVRVLREDSSSGATVARTYDDVFERGKWVHIAIVKNGTGATATDIYINGKETVFNTEYATTFTDPSVVRYVGSRYEGNKPFKGAISSIRFFDSALTATNIEDLYECDYVDASNVAKEYLLGSYNVSLTLEGNAEFVPTADMQYESGEQIYPVTPNSFLTTISEGNELKKTFYAIQTPISAIDVWVLDAGTGNWTLTVHDEDNTSIGTVTVSNANVTEGGYTSFTFSSALDLAFGEKYHVHLTSTVADGRVRATNVSSLTDADMKIYSEASSESHEMEIVNGVLYFGDRNYVHQVYSEGSKHYLSLMALDLPKQYTVTCLKGYRNKLLIGTKVSDAINSAKVYVWDTWSVSFNYEDSINEQGVNAFLPDDNYMYVSAGVNGNVYFFNGSSLELVHTMKGSFGSGSTARVNPNASVNYRGLLMFGYSNVEGNPLSQGVYSLGSRNSKYPRVLNLEYPLSIRSGGEFVLSGLEIGAMCVNDNLLYVSWKHTDSESTETFGVDVIDTSNKVDGAYFKTRYFILDRINREELKKFVVSYRDLPSGTDMALNVYPDHGSAQEVDLVAAEKGDNMEGVLSVPHNICMLKLELSTSGNDAPEVEEVNIFNG